MVTTVNAPASTSQTPTQSCFGNIQAEWLIQQALTPAAVGAATTAEQTFTITGLQVGDSVQVSKPTTQAGLGIVNARVSAANTIAIAFINPTAGSLTPTAGEVYGINVVRPTTQSLTNGLPVSALTS